MKEFELINKLVRGSSVTDDMLLKGIGDDCAVIAGSSGKDWLVTTDALYEGIHFNRDFSSPRTLGRKALSVNISDIAAMGGRPLYYLVSIGIPEKFGVKEIEEIFAGMSQISARYKMSLIGGDTCRSRSGLLLNIVVIGEVDHTKCLYRSGAGAGDSVFVTGTLGGSALGLACAEKGLRNIHTRDFSKMHDDPIPRVATGNWLAASTCVTAMIDVSDGLVSDLGHIASASGVGMSIEAGKLPLPDDFVSISAQCGKDPLTLALIGGEDYELVFTVSSSKLTLFEKMLGVMLSTFGHAVTKIGRVVGERGVVVRDMHGADIPLSSTGFEHKF